MMYLHGANDYYLTRFMTFGFTCLRSQNCEVNGEKKEYSYNMLIRHFFGGERKSNEKNAWCVMLCNAFSTHVTTFLNTRLVRQDFPAVCLSFCGNEDKQGRKVQTKILPISYLLERIDLCCKV